MALRTAGAGSTGNLIHAATCGMYRLAILRRVSIRGDTLPDLMSLIVVLGTPHAFPSSTKLRSSSRSRAMTKS